jgi:dolichol-phosphate mannosyltransferase
MKLSVIIPARNEAESIGKTVAGIFDALSREKIPHEILVVDDHSKDGTFEELEKIKTKIPTLIFARNTGESGFGRAVVFGLDRFSGDCAAIMMADASDSPDDLVRFYRTMLEKKCDCVFGDRFAKGGSVANYPWKKLVLNRIVNNAVSLLFFISYNDCTNAFKMYSREAVEGLRPFLSASFNLTLELPLKAIVRGFSYEVVPNSWTGRKFGVPKLRLKEAGSRYLFIVFYCLAEKYVSGKDYRRRRASEMEM